MYVGPNNAFELNPNPIIVQWGARQTKKAKMRPNQNQRNRAILPILY